MSALLDADFWTTVLATTVLLTVPLLLAATGECINQLGGVLNIGIEGIMLWGAFAGFGFTRASGSNWIGVMGGTLVGIIAGLVLAWFFVTAKADQVVVGIAFNALALGSASYGYSVLFASSGAQSVSGFDALNIFGLGDLPFIGPIVFGQAAPVYLTVVLVAGAGLFIRSSTIGLAIRGVGENPRAADAAGLSVSLVRYIGVLFSGGFAGLAGAVLVLTAAYGYRDTVIGGKGFIAVAIVIFGAWSVPKVVAAALVFGFIDALQLGFQSVGIGGSPQLMFALPYIVTAIAVSGILWRTRQPTALLVPYYRA